MTYPAGTYPVGSTVGMFGRYPAGIPFASVTDGLSNTIMVGETLPGNNVFNGAYDANFPVATTCIPLNNSRSDNGQLYQHMFTSGFTSLHPGGANFAMGDGSIHFFNEAIDYKLYNDLGTRRRRTSEPAKLNGPRNGTTDGLQEGRRRNRAAWSCLPVLLAISCLSGCAPKHPATAPVRGVVAYGGGPWPKAGALFFTVVEPGSQLPRRPGIAKFDTDGNFAVTTWRDADGLMPGKYRVGVECCGGVPPVIGGPPPVSYVPASYPEPGDKRDRAGHCTRRRRQEPSVEYPSRQFQGTIGSACRSFVRDIPSNSNPAWSDQIP